MRFKYNEKKKELTVIKNGTKVSIDNEIGRIDNLIWAEAQGKGWLIEAEDRRTFEIKEIFLDQEELESIVQEITKGGRIK